ncbi:MAG: GNAT family N-acetyltransferase [Actinomycetota bacterium]
MIEFRALTSDDLGLLSGWLAEPHVAQWWGEPLSLAAVEAKYGPRIRGEQPTEVFVVTDAEESIGLIQRYRFRDDPASVAALKPAEIETASAAGIDYFLGDTASTGHGVGATMIDRFTLRLFTDLSDIERVLATPHPANHASRRALEASGYRLVWIGELDRTDIDRNEIDRNDPSGASAAAVYVRERPQAL